MDPNVSSGRSESPRNDPDALHARSTAQRSAQLSLHSHDHQWGYDVDLEIYGLDGRTVFEDRYYLQPGQSQFEADIVPKGTYIVKATLDNEDIESIQCRIDESPAGSVVIEVGNGALSLTKAR